MIRDAMGKVWNDPEVDSARKALQAASEAYRKALHDAIGKQDPELRKILMKALDRGGMRGGHDDGPGRFHPPRRGSMEGLLRGLNEEERKIVKAASEKARQSEAVKAAEAKRKSAQGMKEMMAAAREYRNVLHKAMVEADPRVAKLLRRGGGPGRDGRPPGAPERPRPTPAPEAN